MSAGGKEVGRISIRVVPDLDNFRSKIVAVCEEIEKAVKIKIEVTADIDGLREKIKAATEGIGDVEIGVDLDAAGAKAHMAALMDELRAEARDVHVDVDVDSAGASMNRLGSSAAGAASGLPHLSHGLLVTAAVAAFAAPALALLSGALLVLPTLITAVLAPIGALVLGMGGIKKAAEAAGLIGEGKKGKTTLGAQLKDLQSSVSDVFQAGLTPVFQQLTQLFPSVKAGMVSVAGGLVDVAKGFTNVITSQKGMDQIKDIFTNIGSAISASAPGFANFTSGLLTLVNKVSAKLPSLSKMFNGWGESFTKWIDKITKDDWTGRSPLDRGMKSFKDTLKEVLDLVGDLAKKGFEFLSDPKFGDKMKEFVNDIKTLVNDILPGLASFFKDISGAITDITSAIKLAQGKELDPKKGEKNPLAPGMVHKKDGSVDAPFLEPDNIKKALSALNLPVLLMNMIPPGFWSTLWNGLTTSAITAWDGVKVIAQTAMNSLSLAGAGFSTMWSGLQESAQTAWAGVQAVFQAGVAGLSTIWGGIAAAAAGAWNSVVSAAQTAMTSLVTAVQSGISQAVAFFQSLPGQAVAALANLGSQLFSAGAAAVGQLVKGLMSVDVKGAVGSLLGGIGNLIPHSPAKEGPFSGSGWTALYTGGQSIGETFSDGLKDGFQGVIQQATTLLQELQQAVSQGVVPPDLKKNLQQELKAISVEYDQLKVARDNATDPASKKSISEQMKQLQSVRDQLRLQSDQLGYNDKYGDNKNGDQNQLGQSVNKMVDIAKGFGQATLGQFENDIGISGQGAIPQIADQGLTFLTGMLSKVISGGMGGGTTINVGSVDDAMTIKQREANKAALQYNRR